MILTEQILRSIIREEYKNVASETKLYDKIVDKLMNDIESRYPVDLFIYYNKFANTIILSKIVLDKKNRSKGIGTKIMDELCEFADTNKLRIALTPSSDFGGSKTRLIQFYKNFGFKKYKGYEFKETMVREPQ